MTFRRLKDLPCRISKNICLRLHPQLYLALKEQAAQRTLDLGVKITIGDIIREQLLATNESCAQLIKSSKEACASISSNETLYQGDMFVDSCAS